ncbi:MAG TPA: hypothetical protein VG328_22950 [Stellaceae bacterium]|jgi:hypothetical protein|nr:hypothetical protein [Stellaceae bacterium]
MIHRGFAKESEQRQATEASFHVASERAKNSPDGMRETARGLRERALQMPDSNDRDTMLRLATEYERRANHREGNS